MLRRRWCFSSSASSSNGTDTSSDVVAPATPLPLVFPVLATASDVDTLIACLYSSSFLASIRHPCTAHVTSVYAIVPPSPSSPTALPTLRVTPRSPRSPYDAFALNVQRARSDLLVLTGRILRDEPQLTGDVFPAFRRPLNEWRRTRCALLHPPDVAVMTAGEVMDWGHPLFAQSQGTVYVYTTAAHSATLRARVGLSEMEGRRREAASAQLSESAHDRVAVPLSALRSLTPSTPRPPHSPLSSDRSIVVVSPRHRPTSLSDLLCLFRRTHPVVSIECGPSTTSAHYAREGSSDVDELMLSIYSGPLHDRPVDALVQPIVDVPVLTDAWLRGHFRLLTVSEAGHWRFERHRSRGVQVGKEA